MNKIPLTLLLCVCCSSAQAAPVFECTDRAGRTLYTQEGGSRCTPARLGRQTVYSSALPAAPAKAEAAVETAPNNQADDTATARNAVERARAALEAGRQVRYGNERNYAKYLERIGGLEQQLKDAEAALEAAASAGR
ncbi:DUF4124 domain-containing protein [Bergeriella denitrificans]|uniref:DUF4124 domain-containing protein n=1 Tax=Bergeriella denitrificans TaxID=494 RepID=A0A378UGL0_BERDE|nr:DUF4124 domain-containing protein [Bergeriella denitrificans]STZ76280.1 Uncharacterised protein [Bergeriella denitrificans]